MPTTQQSPVAYAPPSDAPRRQAPGSVLRVGLVGAGKMSLNHARAIGTLTGAELVAFADPSAEAREKMHAVAPPATAFERVDSMLAEADLDIVHVCTPPSTHAAIAEQALLAGCHVYVEKPFVESMEELVRLQRLAEERGLKLCAGHQLLYEAPTRVTDQYLRAIGRVVHVESYFSFRTVRRAPGGRAPLRPDLQLLDILPHPVYLLMHYLEQCTEGTTELVGLDVSEQGTVHALVRRGQLTGTLVVTLEGRPVESYVRLSGTNGSLNADYVRGTVQRHIGPGTSGIDKVFAPYRLARQLLGGTTSALATRVLKKQKSYPGLGELFGAFYDSIRTDRTSPVSPWNLRETTAIWEQVAARLAHFRNEQLAMPMPTPAGRRVAVVTGGTGFLGKQLSRQLLEDGYHVRVLARREPASWERLPGVEYRVADLGAPLDARLLADADTLVHAAAETAGGWTEHQRNSIDATENVLRAAAAQGVRNVVHVSSVAVLAGARVLADDSALEGNSRGSGPYVWGKLESERLARRLGAELGLQLRVVRPGPIVDWHAYEPPGRLGKRLGNIFVAVGSPGQRLGVVEVGFAARMLSWIVQHPDEAPAVLNLINPGMVTKRELLARLRRENPDLTVLWLPSPVLGLLSGLAIMLQKILRPGKPAMSLRKVFAAQRYDTARIAALAGRAGAPSAAG